MDKNMGALKELEGGSTMQTKSKTVDLPRKPQLSS